MVMQIIANIFLAAMLLLLAFAIGYAFGIVR